ncbi:MAG: hypothetical protein H6745_26935 [Deltaproteobacteria bacterium]|nr:hypothetical protein [Deltaproteobacteria bacterium]
MAASPPPIRLPAQLARYTCGRSLVCCQTPWGVYLDGDEPDTIARHLADVGGLAPADARRRVAAALERPGRGLLSLRRRDGGCALLEAHGPERGCSLQRAAGLGALPRTCQTFPRLVTRVGDLVEVAFLLDCPTVARHVVAARGGFAWAELPARDFPYPVGRVAAAAIAWTASRDVPRAELLAWRAAWWAALADAAEARALGPALAALLLRPEAPGARDDAPSALLAWSPAWGGPISDALRRLHASEADLPAPPPASALEEGPSEGALTATLAQNGGALALAASVLLQHAGVHDSRPALDAARGAAWQTLVAAALAARLTDAGLGVDDALVMALSTAAQVARTLPTSHRLGASF